MTPTPGRRVAVVLLLLAVLGGAVFADRVAKDRVTNVRALPGTEMPEAPPESALSSSWYCPGGNADGTGALEASVTILNPRTEGVKAKVTVVPSTGEAASSDVDLGPSSSTTLVLNQVLKAPWAAALVEVDGGGVVVEQQNGNASEFDTTPCSPAASTTWYFASGSTAKDATQTLALFNPFPDDAIVDLAFATPEGRRVPGDFAAIVVPAASVVPVDIGAHVRRQDVVSTEVKARAGRVVASQGLVRTGPGAGVSMTLGAPKLGLEWVFPDGLVSDTVAERFEFFNPGLDEARVDVELALEEGEAEPFEITVPPQGRFTLDMRAEERVPKGVAHAALVVSINNVPVVVSRVIEAAAPGSRQGRSDTLGARRTSGRWGLAVGSATEATDEWVVVYNPGTAPATVSMTAMAGGQRVAIEGLQGISVPAGRRMGFRLTDHIKRDALPVVVETAGEVVVERALYWNGKPGLASSMGIPLE